MRIDALVEDKSGSVLVYHVLAELLKELGLDCPLAVYPHRGVGHLPDESNLLRPPKANEMGLLSQLPAKLRAYNKVYGRQSEQILLLVVLDADDRDPNFIFDRIKLLADRSCPAVSTVIGVAVEELEAWLLGDPAALLQAYPDADQQLLSAYEQDSVCGTWEKLAKILLGDRAEALLDLGYPAVGRYKYHWAADIAPYMKLSANRSPSFKRFYKEVKSQLEQLS